MFTLEFVIFLFPNVFTGMNSKDVGRQMVFFNELLLTELTMMFPSLIVMYRYVGCQILFFTKFSRAKLTNEIFLVLIHYLIILRIDFNQNKYKCFTSYKTVLHKFNFLCVLFELKLRYIEGNLY